MKLKIPYHPLNCDRRKQSLTMRILCFIVKLFNNVLEISGISDKNTSGNSNNISVEAVEYIALEEFYFEEFLRLQQVHSKEFYLRDISCIAINPAFVLTASIKELLRRLLFYSNKLNSIKFQLNRKQLKETCSIFFGLCCSSPGYIFKALFGTSSYPHPVNEVISTFNT